MKKNKWQKSIGVILGILLCAGVGYLAGSLGVEAAASMPKTTLIALVALFIPIFMIVIGIHEAGHALAGILVHFDFKMYVVGPFMWEKEQDRWRFKWNTNVNTAGGMVICLPTEGTDLGKRFSYYAAGGPVASLLLTALAYGIYRLISTYDITSQVALQILAYSFVVMAFLSFVIFVSTIIPMHIGGFSSDGARILRLLRGGETARFEMLIIKIIAGSTSGIRPKLLNMDELLEAKALANKLEAPFGVYLHSYLHQAAFDNGDLDKAEQHLMDYIKDADEIPEGLRNTVWLDAAFFYAFAKNDLPQANQYWIQYKPAAMIPKAQVLATEAAISRWEKEKEVTISRIDASLKELNNMLDKGVAIALKEKLLDLKKAL